MSQTPDQSQVRRARNEVLTQQHNDGLARKIKRLLPLGTPELPVQLECECSDLNCTENIFLTPEQYIRLTKPIRHFVLAKGHIQPDIEDPVDEADSYVVVAKRPNLMRAVTGDELA